MTFYVEEECRLFPDAEADQEESSPTESSSAECCQEKFAIAEVAGQVMEAVLAEENCPYEAQVNLLLTDNEGIRGYNKEYRGIDEPTDVLSFPGLIFAAAADFAIAEKPGSPAFDPENGELLLGDIIISVEKLRSQAADYGHSLKRELAFLVAHSIFHLCGYDHQSPEDALGMEEKQEKILQMLGISRV